MDRTARCACGTTRPSSEADKLAFFEGRGPGTQDHVCKNCRYHEVAHTRTDVPRNRHVCETFEPMVEGYPTDTFYCGHGGWD